MSHRARDYRAFERYWDGKGSWGMTTKRYAYVERQQRALQRPASKVLLHKGRKP
jgi:hypothetical protein